ncbi:hypothetical protein BDZ45DRAFT_746763 [Acephala macrosclerotiorum]|nr:hypothetical protein BDZ45DRAFT_746763 [Acephala macrosclerotiorum]
MNKQEVVPDIGWSNAVPDAIGVAYHDKPFTDNDASWSWGHGRVGGYFLVWFDFLAANRTEYVSAYVSKNDGIIAFQLYSWINRSSTH